MKRADARLLDRYAVVRRLRVRLLRERWEALTADNRVTLRREMSELIARHDAEQARRHADAAFAAVSTPTRSGHA